MLADEMRKLAEDSADKKLVNMMYNEAIVFIQRWAESGYRKYRYSSPNKTMNELNYRLVANKLKKDGFDVEISYPYPNPLCCAIEISW